jgi:GNAT superfamily N-acetyltransferase
MMNPQQVTADLARIEDTDTILELNKLEYGPSDVLVTRTDFGWRHDQNPAGQAIIPVIRDDQDRVVGFIWLVPLRLRIKGQAHLAATGTNLVIHPDHRNTFGYTKLIRRFDQVFRDENIPLHFSFISEGKYRLVLKQAAQTTSTIPVLLKPMAPPFIFRQRPPASGKEITVQAVNQFDASFDQFWGQVQDKYPVMAVRDSAFLAWRFAQFPSRRYHILVARAGDQMLGYTVIRCATVRGIKTGLVMDLLVMNGSLGEAAGGRLMAEAKAYFQRQGMLLSVGLMVPFSSEYRVLRRAGYARLPQTLAPRLFRFAFFVHDPNETGLLSLSAQDWFITIADYESF